MLLIAAALLTLALAAGAARLLIDIGAVTIESIPGRPTGAPGDPVFPGNLPGDPETLERAISALGTEPALPQALGPYDRLWVQTGDPSGTSDTASWVGAAWRPTDEIPEIPGTPWGAVLLELRGEIDLVAKQVPLGGGTVEPLTFDGHPAVWVTGAHDLTIEDDGALRSYRVNGNVLVWQRDGLTFRLETVLPLEESLAIARSFR